VRGAGTSRIRPRRRAEPTPGRGGGRRRRQRARLPSAGARPSRAGDRRGPPPRGAPRGGPSPRPPPTPSAAPAPSPPPTARTPSEASGGATTARGRCAWGEEKTRGVEWALRPMEGIKGSKLFWSFLFPLGRCGVTGAWTWCMDYSTVVSFFSC
jgi:hypothetical protein